jgi:hypothetical protein
MLFTRVTPAVANHKRRLQWENQTLVKGENYSGGKMSFHMRRENRVRNHTIKGLALVAGAFLVAVALSASANAATLRRGSTGGSSSVTGTLPGSVLWTYYDTCNLAGGKSNCRTGGNGDNILRLINPNGSGNGGIAGEVDTPICAMIYVFDDDEEMVACCGCPITSVGLLTLSANDDLLANPILSSGAPDGVEEGSVAIVATPPTGASPECAPGINPGYQNDSAVANLLGSITHNQAVENNGPGSTSGLTEIGLFDDANGDANNVVYLKAECSALVGNGSTSGVCTCGFGS